MSRAVVPTEVIHRRERYILVPAALKILGVTRGRVFHLVWEKRLRAITRRGRTYVRERDVALYRLRQATLAKLRIAR